MTRKNINIYWGEYKLRNRITELLGVQYPIIQGGLHQLGRSQLVTAVAEAGAFGLITASSYDNKVEMQEDIERVRKKTKKPFGVNMSIGIRNNTEQFVDGIIESGISIVFTSGYSPEKYMKQFRDNNVKVIHVVPSIQYAKKAEELGCSGVVAVGKECGGHPGRNAYSTLHLMPEIIKSVSVPVIAAGGFYDGKGLAIAQILGCEAVQYGTRFVMTQESPLHQNIKQLFLKASRENTLIIKESIGKPNRVYQSIIAEKVLELEKNNAPIEKLLPYIGGEAYKKMLETGDINHGVISVGECIGFINDIPTVDDLIKRIMHEYRYSIEGLNHLLLI
ncbi:NAD(P)H-dependent flavin oxidoreductase [Peribacillus simplex]